MPLMSTSESNSRTCRALMSAIPALMAILGCVASAAPQASTAASAPADSRDITVVHTGAADIPLSQFVSAEARRAVADLRNAPPEPNFGADVKALRAFHSKGTDKTLEEMRRLYAASVTSQTIGGVRADVVMPEGGPAPHNRQRVLLSLHSGGFLWGAGSESLLEAIPIAVTSRIKVIAIDYRMAPEATFPAASEDVAAVYRELLKTYRPENIG